MICLHFVVAADAEQLQVEDQTQRVESVLNGVVEADTGDTCGEVNGGDFKYSITVRSTTTSALPATRKVPFASLISIDPTADGEDTSPGRPDLHHEMSDRVTASSLLGWLFPSRPSRYFLRQ